MMATLQVAINLNPYQGLKRNFASGKRALDRRVAINLNPYQGLKRCIPFRQLGRSPVAINLNPYQGLKQVFLLPFY